MNEFSLWELYKRVYLYRCVEEKLSSEYASGEIRCPIHLSVGQELLPALYSMSLRDGDKAVSTHRAHLHFLAHGGSPKSLFSEVLGRSGGCSSGFGGSMHLVDEKKGFMGSTAIVGNSIPVGVGVALSEKIKKRGSVTTIFLGDAATEEGVFFESLNFASLAKLPVLFLCENNGYSVYSPIHERRLEGKSISEIPASLGVRAWRSTGLDPWDLGETLSEAFTYVREKELPAFIEVASFRRLEHCGPSVDDHLGYRPKSEILEGIESDSLPRVRADLVKDSGEDLVVRLENELREELVRDFEVAKADSYAVCDDFEKIVYAT